MANLQTPHSEPKEGPQWLTSLVLVEPRVPLAGPYMAYLLVMMLTDAFPDRLHHFAIVLHIAAAGWVTWRLRRYWPPLGRAHAVLASFVGVLAAGMWVAGQHWLDAVQIAGHDLGGQLSLTLSPPFLGLERVEVQAITERFTGPAAFWSHVILKITRAVTVVPIVEELFWRGFILRALVSWDRFDEVPLGKFTVLSFIGASLLSVLQHPANWGVSIACWMLFNALFYWKRSLLCLMLTHAITNLALYAYVVHSGDWRFW